MFTEKLSFIKNTPVILLAMLCISGCSEDVQVIEQAEPVKAIKHMTVQSKVSTFERKLSGYIRAVKRSDLSFQISGQLRELNVEVGDKVDINQSLASIDAAPYEYRLEQAQAELASAVAVLKKSRENYQRQKIVFEKKIINQSAMDLATSDFAQAKSSVKLATSRLALANRDLSNTVLKAPFSGMIIRRNFQSFEEVSASQPVFEIQGENEFEVTFLVPSTLIGHLNQGTKVNVRVPVLGAVKQSAVITKLGIKSDVRGAYPVSAVIESPDEQIKSGMSADIFININEINESIIVPDSAVVINENNQQQVFVFDPKTNTVTAQVVKTSIVNVNHLQIDTGLVGGEIICIAGAEFLRDGQTVSLYQSSH